MPSNKPQKNQAQAIWQPRQTAPKNQLILANTGYPWPVLARWCDASEKWATACLTACEMADGKADVWFETEYEDEKALIGWMPIPKLHPPLKTGQTLEAKK